MKLLRFVLILLLAAGVLTGCKTGTGKNPEEVVNTAFAAFKGGSEEPVFLGVDGTPSSAPKGTGLAEQITAQLHYEVLELKAEKNTAQAKLSITTPDAAQLIHQALEGMETYDEEAFTSKLETLLQNPQMKTFTVEVQLQNVDGQWLLVPNAELYNAITGGLIEEYQATRQSIIDSLTEGGES